MCLRHLLASDSQLAQRSCLCARQVLLIIFRLFIITPIFFSSAPYAMRAYHTVFPRRYPRDDEARRMMGHADVDEP